MRRLVQVVHAVIMRVINAGEMNRRAMALDAHRFVEQHANAEILHARHHADGVVVAEHGVHLPLEMRAQLREAIERRLVGAAGAVAVVAGEHAQVVVQRAHALDQGVDKVRAHVEMQVAQVQQGVAVEGRRQAGEGDVVLHRADAQGVAPAAAVQPDQAETAADHGMGQVPVFKMEKMGAAAEHLGLVLLLETEALAQVHAPEALHEAVINGSIHPERAR